MSDELIPCPFCGKTAGIENGPPELWYVECTGCGISGKIRYSKEAAIEVWNRRAPAAPAVQDAAPVPAIPPVPIDIRQTAINRTCIDGHLNSALDAVMRSNSPDGTFCILGVLATAAIDIALELAAAPQSTVPQDAKDAKKK